MNSNQIFTSLLNEKSSKKTLIVYGISEVLKYQFIHENGVFKFEDIIMVNQKEGISWLNTLLKRLCKRYKLDYIVYIEKIKIILDDIKPFYDKFIDLEIKRTNLATRVQSIIQIVNSIILDNNKPLIVFDSVHFIPLISVFDVDLLYEFLIGYDSKFSCIISTLSASIQIKDQSKELTNASIHPYISKYLKLFQGYSFRVDKEPLLHGVSIINMGKFSEVKCNIEEDHIDIKNDKSLDHIKQIKPDKFISKDLNFITDAFLKNKVYTH